MNSNPTPALLRKADLLRMLCISKSTLHAKLAEHGPYFDPSFPKPFRYPNSRSPIWRLEQILAWVERAANESDLALAVSDRCPSRDSIKPVPVQPRQRVARRDPAMASHVTSDLNALPADVKLNVSMGEQAAVGPEQVLAVDATQPVHPPIVEETPLAARRRQAEAEATAIRGMMGKPRRSPLLMNFPLSDESIRQPESKLGVDAKSGANESNRVD